MKGILRSEADGWRALLDDLPIAVITTETSGRIRSWNQGAEDLYGRTAEQAIGRRLSASGTGLAAPDRWSEVVTALRTAALWEGTTHVRRHDGTVVSVKLVATALLDGNGAVDGYLVLAGDELRARGPGLREALVGLEAAVERVADIGPLVAGPESAVPGWGRLSQREQRVAELLRRGHRVSAIAERLGISANTVHSHLGSVFSKLGVRSQAELLELLGAPGRAPGAEDGPGVGDK